jgi:outer membrane protease
MNRLFEGNCAGAIMTVRYWLRAVLVGCVALLGFPARAEDMTVTSADGTIVLSGGIGVTSLEAEEIVYYDVGDPTVVSYLLWQSTAPLLTANLDIAIPDGWTFSAHAQVAMSGDSTMADYDWIDPASYDFDDWSDRSISPDTNLDWYFNGSLFVGHDFAVSDGLKINLNAGLKYVDVQWSAYGGSYVYSSGPGSPRDLVGDFPDGELGITYRQFFPAAVVGLDAEFQHDAWTFDIAAHGGVTFMAGDTDTHWLRTDIGPDGGFFDDTLSSAPVVQLAASASYALSESLDFVVSGAFEQIFVARGDTDMYGLDGDTMEYIDTYIDQVGGGFRSASLTAGLKGRF